MIFKRNKNQLKRLLKAILLYHYIFKKDSPFVLEDGRWTYPEDGNKPSLFKMDPLAKFGDESKIPLISGCVCLISGLMFVQAAVPMFLSVVFFSLAFSCLFMPYFFFLTETFHNFKKSNIYYSSDFEAGSMIFVLFLEEPKQIKATIFDEAKSNKKKAKEIVERPILITELNSYKSEGSCQLLDFPDERSMNIRKILLAVR